MKNGCDIKLIRFVRFLENLAIKCQVGQGYVCPSPDPAHNIWILVTGMGSIATLCCSTGTPDCRLSVQGFPLQSANQYPPDSFSTRYRVEKSSGCEEGPASKWLIIFSARLPLVNFKKIRKFRWLGPIVILTKARKPGREPKCKQPL